MGIKNYIDNKGFWSENKEGDSETLTQISGTIRFLGEILAPGFADLPLLILLVENGPFEAYGPGTFHEIQYQNKVFPKNRTWYVDSSKNKKILEQNIEYNSNKTPNQIVWKVYNKDGTTIKKMSVDTISYVSGTIFESTRIRNIF